MSIPSTRVLVLPVFTFMGFLGSSDGKESACNEGDVASENPLEEEMATYPSILAWRIPWTEQPGGLQSMGSEKVGHD